MYVKSPVVVRKETETPKCRFYGQVTVLSKVKYQESSPEKKESEHRLIIVRST